MKNDGRSTKVISDAKDQNTNQRGECESIKIVFMSYVLKFHKPDIL
jgi:hypothetical protein